MYDSLYAVCTDLIDDNVADILKVSEGRWQIEDCFRTMKTDFEARPVYLNRENRIKAHFLTCFLALLHFRLLNRSLKQRNNTTEYSLVQQNHYLFDYYDELLKDIGLILDIDFGKRIRTLGEIKKILAKTKK